MDNDQAASARRLAWICIAAAVLSGVAQGVWEMAYPILNSEQAYAAGPLSQRWAYAVLGAIKSIGFLAGLFGFFWLATHQGNILKIFMGLAVAGGIFFAAVWLIMAWIAHFTLAYVFGGMWYQMFAPVALGIAAIPSKRIPRWAAVYAIFLGVLNSQIFTLLAADMALIVQGVLWVIFGYLVYVYRAAREDALVLNQ
jgi:hypothetical protein